MIKPAKYLDLRSSVLNVTALIISELIKLPAIKIEEMREIVVDRLGEEARINFLPAMSLLYAVGKVEFDSDLDAIVPCDAPAYASQKQ